MSDRVGDEAVASRLRDAPMEIIGRFADASNATLLARLTDRDARDLATIEAELGRAPEVEDLDPDDLAVYKPQRGERPLWDYPHGTLHQREIAAYTVSAALGWDLVPVTVLREQAPFGPGSVQRFVPHDPQEHYFSVMAALEESDDRGLRDELVAMVLFDLVVDNADRKGGHVLRRQGPERPRLQLVDHGVTFNVVRKLRTVGWDLAGHEVPAARRDALVALRARLDVPDDAVTARLAELLAPAELEVFASRVEEAAALDVLPPPRGDHPYPWPLL